MDRQKFAEAQARWKEAEAHLKDIFPDIVVARRQYFKTPTLECEVALQEVEQEAARRMKQVNLAFQDMEGALGDFAEFFESDVSSPPLPSDHVEIPRRQLTSDRVPVTGDILTILPKALDALGSLVPADWLKEQSPELCRLKALRSPDAFLSITKGMRPKSEETGLHKLRQAMFLADDFLNTHPDFDHFAGALALAELAQFGYQLENIKEVRGHEGRMRDLWASGSSSVHSTFMELFTGGRCVEFGQTVEFIGTSNDKSPDLRCSTPYPMVVECKRQDTFTQYELDEEKHMSALFQLLDVETKRLGMSGIFQLELGVEARLVNKDEVVAKLVGQRFLPNPANRLAYSWGSTSFQELPTRVPLPSVTRAYSPQMLEYVFGWKSDLPEVDGLCCHIQNTRNPFVDEVIWPVGLHWINRSEAAVKKRTWAPARLFGSAASQIPPGEFGMAYVAYVEGARPDIADERVRQYQAIMTNWTHSDKIRLPITVLCRLHPFALEDGKPDLIESNIRYCSDQYGDPNLFDYFPTTIFTSNIL